MGRYSLKLPSEVKLLETKKQPSIQEAAVPHSVLSSNEATFGALLFWQSKKHVVASSSPWTCTLRLGSFFWQSPTTRRQHKFKTCCNPIPSNNCVLLPSALFANDLPSTMCSQLRAHPTALRAQSTSQSRKISDGRAPCVIERTG